jgi:hypothetical protein
MLKKHHIEHLLLSEAKDLFTASLFFHSINTILLYELIRAFQIRSMFPDSIAMLMVASNE